MEYNKEDFKRIKDYHTECKGGILFDEIKQNGCIIANYDDATNENIKKLSLELEKNKGKILFCPNFDIENTKIHTSCSDPIGPGLISGDFTVIAGESKKGGELCPLEP